MSEISRLRHELRGCGSPTKRHAFASAAAILVMTMGTSAMCAAAPAQRITSWQKQSDGVTLRTASGGVLRLQVWNADVIRVSYVPASTFPTTPSLAVIGKPVPTAWRAQVDHGDIVVRTKDVQARVDRGTGAVRFLNAAGTAVLSELPSKRKAEPVAIAGAHHPVYQISQQFALPRGEAIYGLGQHQNGMMDYRNGTVTLLQQNRDVGVPFLVSSRGYGVLWDTPSVTTVNVGAGDREVIPSPQLYTEDGKRGGLTGRYYEGQDFGKLVATRVDPKIDFLWTSTPPPGLPHDHYSVRWTGFVQAEQAGDYTLVASTDDGVRVWIDDKQVIDDWTSRAVKDNTATVHFDRGSRHKIRFDFYQDAYDSIARLSWQLPATASSVKWSSEAAGDIDYYFVYGPSIDRVIASYRNLTGRAPMPPKWALGFWQSKERYQSQQELLDIVGRYRRDRIPLDVIVQDWQYWSPHPWGSHEFDAARYPDPKQMMRDLHAEHAHLMISVWAKFDAGSENFKELGAAGGLYPNVIRYVYPPGQGQWYDPFNPVGRRVYWGQISRELFALGIDGWWLDASEPELSGAWGEFRNYQTGAGPGALVFNAYPLEHTRAVYEGQRTDTDRKRVMILTRSAYTGQQRNGASTWSGDITGDWSTFAKQIPAGLNFCLSGIPYWNTDIGGFFCPYRGGSSNPQYGELFTRWFEFGAFCPTFRVHGTDTPKELWRFGPETEKTLVKYDRLRYRLMPYLYSNAWQVTHGGGTMMRALVMDFPNDRAARESKDEFLFGPSILVCPVITQGAVMRDVYLPAGTSWTDFWTGKAYHGGQTITADAPIDKEPLYVRTGAIVPMGPAIQYAADNPDGPIDLRVYRGANGSFTLYGDDGTTYDYEKGAYATIPVTWDDARQTLTIGARSGKYAGMPSKRTFRIVLVSPSIGVGVEPSKMAAKVVMYAGKPIRVRMR